SMKTMGGDDYRTPSHRQGMSGQSLESENIYPANEWNGAGPPDPLNPRIRTAICVEPRGGCLHVFMPPVDRIEGYLELLAAVETTAASLGTPVMIEGYLPPHDDRIQHLSVTPDPGVIEVNVQ